MPSINKTPNLNLTQYTEEETTSYLTDYNQDMLNIDTGYQRNANGIKDNQTALSTLQSNQDTMKTQLDVNTSNLSTVTQNLSTLTANYNALSESYSHTADTVESLNSSLSENSWILGVCTGQQNINNYGSGQVNCDWNKMLKLLRLEGEIILSANTDINDDALLFTLPTAVSASIDMQVSSRCIMGAFLSTSAGLSVTSIDIEPDGNIRMVGNHQNVTKISFNTYEVIRGGITNVSASMGDTAL